MVEPTGVKRKLAVILAADVEGFTRLMRADEEVTLKTLNQKSRPASPLPNSLSLACAHGFSFHIPGLEARPAPSGRLGRKSQITRLCQG